ncbi:hypothetical protein [Actinoplanes sp. TFC3]|uniref:hypothetical protein n=1 Tax=Actinoplanes sp. TFC3 TaxID=1710355 RepID=UPI000829AFC9|nr:hypothetical protein [Actinoplanes sp. TFC3]
MTTTGEQEWVPGACTLPSVERPLRVAEFDELLATTLRGQQRLSPTVLSWDLDPSYEAKARDLTARESKCCSFFTFAFAASGDASGDANVRASGDANDEVSDNTSGRALRLDIEVPAAHTAVLDALQRRAADRMRS